MITCPYNNNVFKTQISSEHSGKKHLPEIECLKHTKKAVISNNGF